MYGGLSKLLKGFILNHNPGDIMTYADFCWSNGESYLKLGFEQVGFLEPQINYFEKQTHQKVNLNTSSTFESDKIVGIWNGGSLKFVLNTKTVKN